MGESLRLEEGGIGDRSDETDAGGKGAASGDANLTTTSHYLLLARRDLTGELGGLVPGAAPISTLLEELTRQSVDCVEEHDRRGREIEGGGRMIEDAATSSTNSSRWW